MLTCLRVRQLAIIDELELELGPGLNVVTGETGAGKSILIEALGLVLGGKGRRELVRTGAERADVEALFEDEGRERVLRRSLLVTGRTRAYVDGGLATVSQLCEAADGLVDISSQHEHHTLVDPATHLGFLDASAGLEPGRAGVAAAVERLSEAVAALDAERLRARNRVEREDLLRFQLGEIEGLGLAQGELAGLDADRDRLRHASTLVETAARGEHALYGRDGSIVQQLGRIESEVEAAARLDRSLEPVVAGLQAARAEAEEAARELGRYARSVQADPRRLEQVEERLFEARRLARKYGGSEQALFAHAAQASEELAGLDALDERLEALEAAGAAALAEAGEAARALSAARRRAADVLAGGIADQLHSLGMGGARVEVSVAPRQAGGWQVDGARLGHTGMDTVEFLIAPNPGEAPRPLRKVASGGELSRALLAVKRVLARTGPAGLYVFDEVDAGVGGGVAEVIGQKLAEVARHHQVLCITHLPQIAVYADAHFRVDKRVLGGRTLSRVVRLTDSERTDELARMMGGVEVTPVMRQAAQEMLERAG